MKSLPELSPQDRRLIEAAAACLNNAYAPYSKFQVGAAVRSVGKRTYAGCNMENVSFGLSICAEVSALAQAVAAGDFHIEAIAVVGKPVGSEGGDEPITPCGRCRQLIAEAAQAADLDTIVWCVSGDLSRVAEHRISELLPYAFDQLQIKT